MPFGVKIIPITPGVRPRGAPSSPSPFPDLNSFKPITEEELASLRRNTVTFLDELAAWDDQGTEIAHRSQSAPLFLMGGAYPMEAPTVEEADFGFLDGYDPEAMLTDEPSSFDIDANQFFELEQLCADTFPNGIPEETDTWATLSELTETASPELISASLLDDIESFFKTFQSVDDLTQHFDTTNMAIPTQDR